MEHFHINNSEEASPPAEYFQNLEHLESGFDHKTNEAINNISRYN